NREAIEREIGRLQVLLEALDDAAADIARDTFDPEAVLAQTDRTPEGAFAWVRDNTHLVPYRGALRGPVGVLMDRMGNSLDRALLLQDLLTRLGYETRLARAHLDPGAASSLLSSLAALPVPAPEPGGAMAPGTLASLATNLGSVVADLQARQDGAEQARAALFDDLNRRREEQSAFLATLLDSPEGGGDSERDSEIDSQSASLRDHWWVQYREGDVWTDLDPTGLEALPGQALGVTAETMAVPEISALPSELRHAVTVRVVVECSVAGALQEFVLVESPAL